MSRWSWGSNYAFAPHTLKHVAVLALVAAIAATVVTISRRVSASARTRLERGVALSMFGIWLIGAEFDFINPHASASTTLPLHWCDLCGLLAAIVMMNSGQHLARSVLHFWALGICSFAFILPAIGLGPAFKDFWIYFGTHAAIVIAAAYDFAARGYRPSTRDLAVAWGLAAAWTLILQPINLALDANYGYVGASEQQVRAAIRALGPWPWRLAPMLAIELAIMTCVLLVERAGTAIAKAFTKPSELDTQSLPFPTMITDQPLKQAA